MLPKPKFKPAYFSKRPSLDRSAPANDIQERATQRVAEALNLELPRLLDLMKHYGISPESDAAGLSLAMRIAKDFVPNFAVQEDRRGRKKEFDTFSQFFEVEAAMRATGTKAHTACKLLAESNTTPSPFKRNADSLEKSHSRMKKILEKDKNFNLLVLMFRAELQRQKPWNAFDVKERFVEAARPLFRKGKK